MRFFSLAQRPRQFLSFTGFTPTEFTELVQTVRSDWKELRVQRLKQDRIRVVGGGAKPILTLLEDRLLVFALYAKLYLPYSLLEHLFGVDESTICRIIQEMSMLLGTKIIVQRPGKRIRTLEELREAFPDIDTVLGDATEQRIPRPQKKRSRKQHHSGKKKAFTIKTQILVNKQGIILHVTDSSPGRAHDYKQFRNTDIPDWLEQNPQIACYLDSGYQGVRKDYPKATIHIPFKRSRSKKELTRSEKIFNTKQRKIRVTVEHVFSRLKKFKILSDPYRNAKERYCATFKSIAFLSNFRTLARAAS